jgi:very-short-patch-repair endonuclease
VISRRQLLSLGLTAGQIDRRLRAGRLHRLYAGVYAVGRPQVTRRGHWMAAVLACGPHAVLSHGSAAALWGVASERTLIPEISVPSDVRRRRRGIAIHSRRLNPSELTCRDAIRVTKPIATLIDLATQLPTNRLEAAVNEADKRDLTDPEALRAAVELAQRRRPGVATLRRLLDRRTFLLSDSELERLFLPIARRAGLPQPHSKAMVDGFEVDFYWPGLELVVETDGLRYHRTPAQQGRDRERDQAHTAAGRTPVRFTHWQVCREPQRVGSVLATVARRLDRQLRLPMQRD